MIDSLKTGRTIMDLAGEPWVDVTEALLASGGRGTRKKKTLTAPDGHRVTLANVNGEARPHFHTKASTLFILDGSMELRGRTAGRGSWVLEPYGAIHPSTRFNNVTYGLGMSDGDFGAGNVGLTSVDDIPEWVTKLGFKIDEWANAVDSSLLPWKPFGPGLSIKILHVFDGRPAFAALMRAEAGATLPRRDYLGPADAYVLSGQIDFVDAAVRPGQLAHHSAGSQEQVARFPVVTEFLANTYGTILEFDSAGNFARAIDGYAFR